jgi:hypothetical protein
MTRTPVFVKAFDRIINVTEIRSVTPVAPFSDGSGKFLSIQFIEKGSMELRDVELDEFFDVLAGAQQHTAAQPPVDRQ